MRVLIAEDAPSDRMLLRLHLEQLGHAVLEVSNGNELVESFQKHNEVLDLLIVDLNMPIKSGAEAVHDIRAIQGTYDMGWIPIIILSGSDSDEDLEHCIASGADDYLTKPVQHKVLSAKLLAMKRLADMRHRLIAMNKCLEALSVTDYLTNLPNRRSFEMTLQDEMSKSHLAMQPLSVAILDIDHFKYINDTFGHDAGDEVLRELSRRLEAEKRQGDLIGRIGGEEFGLYLPSTSAKNALAVCERYRELITERPFVYGRHTLYLTVSVGVCEFTSQQSQLELIKGADAALYSAKNAGRNRVQLGAFLMEDDAV